MPSVFAAAQVVIAVPARVEHQRHQPAADQQREHDAAGNGDVAVERQGIAAEPLPGGAGEPDRCREQGEQSDDEQGAHEADIGCAVSLVITPDSMKNGARPRWPDAQREASSRYLSDLLPLIGFMLLSLSVTLDPVVCALDA